MKAYSTTLANTLAAVVFLALLWTVQPSDAVDAKHEAKADGVVVLPQRVRFNRDIRPIFSGTCFACHGPDANTREAKLRMDVRADAITKRDGIQAILPGDAEESEAWLLITATNPKDQMPPSDFHTQLSPRDKAMIKKWIEQGAEYEKHWAFIPPKRPVEPKVKYSERVRNPIDAFVLARLDAEGLEPAAEADRRTLARRVALDLTGLPPTAEQLAAFLADNAADAYERYIDRLLDSDAYAEHMARYWLDAARYADTSGYQYDRIRHQWVWRDWVLNAFATNMPFDRFTILQNAGDLVPNATPATRLATGFHRNHPITIEGGVIDEEYRTEYVMDRVVTTTTAWLGLTFTCARCHDHKYDPVSMDDFYSFYAFFNSVPERGLNGFHPMEKIASPLGSRRSDAFADAKAKWEAAIDSSGDQFAEWEQQIRSRGDAIWSTPKPTRLTSVGGATLTRLDDGSVLSGGKLPSTETYEIVLPTTRKPIRTLRLEALPDASLVGGSTGRGTNGNWVLSEIQVESAKADRPDAFAPVKIIAATADYQQNGWPVSAAIDGVIDDKGGWAVDGHVKRDARVAVFRLADPVESGSVVRVRLVHRFAQPHHIGRFRVSVSSETNPAARPAIDDTLTIPRDKRTVDQQSRVVAYLVERFGDDKQRAMLAELRRQEAAVAKATPDTMILVEMQTPRKAYVLERGEYDKAIEERPVEPDVPAVFGGLPEGVPRNRLGLARWLVSRDNPLTARVTVNRFWARIFGTGLVKTIEDFGSQGEYPSHPELLDWLAVEFMDSGWDVRHVLKTILMCRTYRQDSTITRDAFARDPVNRLLARGPRFRIDAEAVRDSALAVSGLLDRSVGGPSVYPYHPEGLWLEINNRPGLSRAYPHTADTPQLYRRSVYTYWKRTVPPPSLASFDAPEREYCVVNRSRTNTPLQAFVLLHDPQFVEAARHLADRMIASRDATDARLAFGFELCTSRKPTEREMAVLRRTLADRLEQYRTDPTAAKALLAVGASAPKATDITAERAAYTAVARVLMNLSEFITKG